MLDHISLRVVDYDKSLEFYKAALAPLGYSLIMEFPGFAGLGEKGKPDFWITKTDKAINPAHVAFRTDRKLVDAFHAAALAAGATDDGAPGPRDYHPSYYGGFVLDPEGNHIEACCHEPPGGMLGAAAEKMKAAGRKLKAAVSGKAKPAAAKAKSAAKSAAGKAATKAKSAAKKAVPAVKKAAAKATTAAKAKAKKATKAAKKK